MNQPRWPVAFAASIILNAIGLLTAAEPATLETRQITNSIGMKLALVPSGEFMMGSRESAQDTAALFNKYYGFDRVKAAWFEDEHPRHHVRITRPFYLGVCHVTRGQFRRFVADTGYKTDAEKGEKPGATAGTGTRKGSALTGSIPGGTRVSSRPTSTRWST